MNKIRLKMSVIRGRNFLEGESRCEPIHLFFEKVVESDFIPVKGIIILDDGATVRRVHNVGYDVTAKEFHIILKEWLVVDDDAKMLAWIKVLSDKGWVCVENVVPETLDDAGRKYIGDVEKVITVRGRGN